MVDSTKGAVNEQLNTMNLGINPKPTSMFQTVIANFREIQQAILDEVGNPQVNAKEQRDAVDVLLQQLQCAVDEENSGKAQEIKEIKDMVAA